MHNNLCLYILMRNDLDSLSPGRAAAQASHATNLFMLRHGGKPSVKTWQKQTKYGFGTCIVLTANEKVIDDIVWKNRFDFIREWVVDPDYRIHVSKEVARLLERGPFDDNNRYLVLPCNENDVQIAVTRQEKTCAYIFGDRQKLSPILKDLPLY